MVDNGQWICSVWKSTCSYDWKRLKKKRYPPPPSDVFLLLVCPTYLLWLIMNNGYGFSGFFALVNNIPVSWFLFLYNYAMLTMLQWL